MIFYSASEQYIYIYIYMFSSGPDNFLDGGKVWQTYPLTALKENNEMYLN